MIRKQSQKSSIVDSLLNNSDKKIDYRKELASREPEIKQAKKIEKDRSWLNQDTTIERYGDPVSRNGSSVRPSRCSSKGGITNMGGPSKQIGSDSNNSIWNSDIFETLSKTASSSENTMEEKMSAKRIRQQKQAEYKQSMTPKIGDEEVNSLMNKSNSVSSISAKGNGKGWIPSNKISMFDDNLNFDRLTALENRVSPKVEKPQTKKVANNISSRKISSSKDMTNRFVDGIVDQKKDSGYKSVRSDITSRLFNALEERNKE